MSLLLQKGMKQPLGCLYSPWRLGAAAQHLVQWQFSGTSEFDVLINRVQLTASKRGRNS